MTVSCYCGTVYFFIQFSQKTKNEPSQNEPITPRYSYAAEPSEQVETTIDYFSDTEFSKAIDGRSAADIWPIMDELMSVLQATNTRLYNGVMRKIEE